MSLSRDTIAAISTPAGEGAIALVRIAGENAIGVADQVFRGKQPPSTFASHTQHLGEIVENGRVIDEVMLSVHRAPHSYTGEDLVEISCHGGMLVTAKVLQACLRAGAREARPGEFTQRAFLNGKLDLTQAEAVIDLIRAHSDLALRSATEQLAGTLGQHFRSLQRELISVLAHVEAGMDFPEEGISPDDTAAVRARLQALRENTGRLLATQYAGRVIREGLRVVIFGATNAGKSSLLNRLLRYDRAIVSDVHGTTRDSIEESADIAGVRLRLFDTAGFREPENDIEREGIERTQRSLETADLPLHIADANAPPPLDFTPTPGELLVLNKCDLPEYEEWKSTEALRISCKTGERMDELESAIKQRIASSNLNPEHPLVINMRHARCLERAVQALTRALRSLDEGATPEMFAVDLGEAQDAFEELLGNRDEEAVRDAIFSQFCIGK